MKHKIMKSILLSTSFLMSYTAYGNCGDAGWTGEKNKSTWSDAKYQACLRGDKPKYKSSTENDESQYLYNTPSTNYGISKSKRKSIFFDIVTAEDNGIDRIKADEQIMSKYKLTKTRLNEIKMEGIKNDWLSEKDGY